MPEDVEKVEKNFQLRMKRSLTRKERLKSREDISRVFRSSAKVSCSGAKLVYNENKLEWNRIAVTLVRKYGNSVVRNRSKRIIREIYRSLKFTIKPGYDMVIVLYPGNYSYNQRLEQFSYLLKKADLLITSP